jgi:hypothetical protein
MALQTVNWGYIGDQKNSAIDKSFYQCVAVLGKYIVISNFLEWAHSG